MSHDSFGYRPRFHIMDEQLHLDPEVQRTIAEIEARMSSRQLVNLFLLPDWNTMLPTWQSFLTRQQVLASTGPTPAGSTMTYTPGAGPSTPRAGELSDVTRAVYQLPAVQHLVLQAHDEAMRQLRVLQRDWDSASTGDRAAMITMSTIVVGSTIAIIVANRETRTMAFDLIKGHDIPVPGVDGLSFQILDRGGSVTAPLGVAGLSGSARLQFPSARSPEYEITVNFDVMEFVRSRR